MKTKLLILLLLCSIAGACQVLRPPIDTKELRTKELEWRGLEMGRDSLSYWWPINSNSFTLSRPDESFSQTYSFPTDSVFWPEYNIWVCSGCQIYYNDSIFYVRRDPECGNCWQYSYNRVSWRELFCESNLDRTIDIVPSSRHILKDGNYVEWVGEDSLDVGVTYLGFKRDSTNEGNWLHFVNDSVKWDALPEDSLYFENLGNWAKAKDTVDLFWLPDNNGINYYDNVGIGIESSRLYQLNISDTTSIYGAINVKSDRNAIWSESQNSSALTGISHNSDAIYGITYFDNSNYAAITGESFYSSMGVYGKSNTGIGVFGESVGIGVKGYSSSDSSGVYGYSLYGPSIKGVGKYSYSAKFTGGLGVVIEQGLQTDSATIGNGSTISRSGTMMSYDLWFGTQAEWNANTPKNGIYPQASTTFWTIKD